MFKKHFAPTQLFTFLAGVALLSAVSPVRADILVAGDTNLVGAINGSYGPFPDDNHTFFANALEGGHSVKIFTGGDTILNTFYNSQPGVTSSFLTGAVTPSSLTGVNLFIVELPQTSFSTSEIAAMKNFSRAGNTLFFIGEHGQYDPAADQRINSALTALGSSLQLSLSVDDGGANIATVSDGQILANPLTSGVGSFVYGGFGVSGIIGGQGLFLEKNLKTPFVAIEKNATVPEPSSLALCLAIGVTGVGLFLRRRI